MKASPRPSHLGFRHMVSLVPVAVTLVTTVADSVTVAASRSGYGGKALIHGPAERGDTTRQDAALGVPCVVLWETRRLIRPPVLVSLDRFSDQQQDRLFHGGRQVLPRDDNLCQFGIIWRRCQFWCQRLGNPCFLGRF